MPYWISDTLAGIPAFLWIYFGLGGLWALALLPRADWRRRVEVIAVAFALGPMLLTVWMFILSTLGAGTQTPTLTYPDVLGGTVVLALVALVIVWRKRHTASAPPAQAASLQAPLLSDERLLIVLVGASVAVSGVVVAYWPFTAYDALWVFGYVGRLYALLGYIPQSIGYYPQFLPLQYAFAQLGGINDHTARAVLPFLHVGSILATYVLGERLVNRRTGMIAAAIWALYPHVGEWSRAGDLEIPLAFLFTLAAAFFLLAWTGHEAPPGLRRRYALIAGLVLGVGLWTKPTMGAFLLGMALLLLLEFVRVHYDWRRWWERGKFALLTGITALPLGGIWYLRNLLLGHTVIVFPRPFWLTLAERSGGEFGWILAALVVWAIYLLIRYPRYNWRLAAIGMALVLLALVPSILSPRRLTPLEFVLLGVGFVALGTTVRRMARDLWDDEFRSTAVRVGWGVALGVPYFATWFYSYSYHYRLSFAVVPLLILPIALILARLFTPQRMRTGALRFAYLAVIVLVAIPGIISPVNDVNGGGDYLWTDKYPD
ncbi:MAG: glycosyltransferase family 39 protein, partial [Chloroflexota bacterium]